MEGALMRNCLIIMFAFAIWATQTEMQVPVVSQKATIVNIGQIAPAMLVWGTGIAAGQITTITQASFGNRKTWRVTDYAQDPAAEKVSDFDLYDMDQATLAPLRSVMNTEEFRLELIFTPTEVTLHKTMKQGDVNERVPLTNAVEPEGPGLDVFVSSLPLAVGYRKRYAIVDRWCGHGATRLKMVTLSVLQRAIEDTSLGKRDVYDLAINPDDRSFQIKEKVLAESPHLPVRVEYTRDGKTYPASEVIAVVSQAQ